MIVLTANIAFDVEVLGFYFNKSGKKNNDLAVGEKREESVRITSTLNLFKGILIN